MGRLIFLAVFALVTTGTTAYAQNDGRIVGRVTNTDGRALPGIQVTVTGIARTAMTDSGGRFTIVAVPAGSRVVRVLGIGFLPATQIVAVIAGEAAPVTFKLETAPTMLSPVVTVGYGEQERRSVTGAVGTAMKALQGRIAGVEIVASSNEPGAAMNVRVRGIRSMNASNDPLYVVDGIPISGGIQDFNPQMIESIDVLKDASATAIYGSRGANGVILVTMKKGSRDGRLHATYTADTYYGNQHPVRLIPMMNLQQYVQYMHDAAAANGQDTSIAKIFTAKQQIAIKNNITTDWQRATLRSGLQRSLQSGLSASTTDTRYALSANYFDQQGVIPGQGYTRASGFGSIDHSSDRLRLGVSTNVSRILTDQGEGGGAYGYALAMTPLGQPYNYTNPDSAGLLDPRPDDDQLSINPVLEAQSVVRRQTVNRVFASAFAEYRIAEGLNFRINFGPDYTQLNNGCFNNKWTHGTCANLGANTIRRISRIRSNSCCATIAW